MTLQRRHKWALIMMGYDYEIIYRPSPNHATADALFRLPSGEDLMFDKEVISEITTEVDGQRFPSFSEGRTGHCQEYYGTLRTVGQQSGHR